VALTDSYTLSLVELIVLNIGLQAGVLDTRTFSMFVVHAIVLTFITTPLTLAFYPPKFHTHPGQHHRAESGTGPSEPPSEDELKTRFALVLDRIEQLPAAMTISHLLHSEKAAPQQREHTNEKSEGILQSRPIAINALHLIELTERTSAVLKSQLADTVAATDPVLSVYKTFGFLNRLVVSAVLSVVSHDEFTFSINRHIEESKSHMVILPWSRAAPTGDAHGAAHSGNPFDRTAHKAVTQNQADAIVYSEFIRRVFSSAPTNVALFVDSGYSTPYAGDGNTTTTHLFLPFFGGPDDRLALSFVVQLCRNASVKATVVRIHKSDHDDDLSPSATREGKGADVALSVPQVIVPLLSVSSWI
jgi:hypothetical protein